MDNGSDDDDEDDADNLDGPLYKAADEATTSCCKKRKRPDYGERKKVNKGLDRSTVKMTLNSFCKQPATLILPAIEHASLQLSQATWEASRLMELHVVRLVTEGRPLASLGGDNIWRQAVCLMFHGNRCDDAELRTTFDKLYEPLRPQELHRLDSLYMRVVITYASNELKVAARNMVKLQLLHRLRRWAKLQVVLTAPHVTDRWRSRLDAQPLAVVTSALMDAFIEGNQLFVPERGMLTTEEETSLRQWCTDVQARHPDLFPIFQPRRMAGVAWADYYALLHEVGTCFLLHVQTGQATGQRCVKGVRMFSMVPLRSFRRLYITVEKSSLDELIKLQSALDRRTAEAAEAVAAEGKKRRRGGQPTKDKPPDVLGDGSSVRLRAPRPKKLLAGGSHVNVEKDV